jgi:hypothetical protein
LGATMIAYLFDLVLSPKRELADDCCCGADVDWVVG